MENKDSLGILLLNNWLYHDQKKYAAIEKNSIAILTCLGYNSEKTKIASQKIRSLFELADADEQIGKQTYKKLIEICDSVDLTLNRPKNSRFEIYWWKAVRNQNFLAGALYLYLDQISKLGLTHPIAALKASRKLYITGKAHNKKDLRIQTKAMEEYWNIIQKVNPKQFIEF